MVQTNGDVSSSRRAQGGGGWHSTSYCHHAADAGLARFANLGAMAQSRYNNVPP